MVVQDDYFSTNEMTDMYRGKCAVHMNRELKELCYLGTEKMAILLMKIY